ncbi:MAG: histidinol phosphate phosphatase [Ignavibacteriales bacterium]|nr:histidinol phosphate phosphatase [Ignavibacteriales bacterium]
MEEKLREEIEFEDSESGIIGEEFGERKSKNGYIWVIDPIDGTIAFSCGKPVFASLIALMKDDIPLIGIIDQPITKERWVGVLGNTTMLNDEPIKSSTVTDLSKAKLSTTAPGMFSDPISAAFFRELQERVHITSFGGDAYQYGLCASGHIDIVVEKGLNLYDWAALVPVLKGSGAIITDWNGEELTSASKGDVVVTGNQNLHDQVLELIRQAAL